MRRIVCATVIIALAGLLVAAVPGRAARPLRLSVKAKANPRSQVGEVVTWTAAVDDGGSPDLRYRFRARRPDEPFHMVVDYGLSNSWQWTSGAEGVYEMEFSVRNVRTGDTATSSLLHEVTPRAVGPGAVVNPTIHTLVYLYSAPPCPAHSQMTVVFESSFGSTTTPPRDCTGASMNFYLAGLRPQTTYRARHVVEGPLEHGEGPFLSFTTGTVDFTPAGYTVLQAPPLPVADGVLLQSSLVQATVATDLYGNLLWYYPENLTSLTRTAGGTMFGFVQDPDSSTAYQTLREFDLAGVTLRETNAERINQQLAALGVGQIGGFHHEVLPLSGGQVAVLASTERILTDVQGPGDVDVIGDMILVLDQDLQVVWVWDAFDHLDPSRMATLGEYCVPRGGGCPPFYLAQQANDWLHSNALALTPDGNLLLSMRHQDWVVKINYAGGGGSGEILWKLGKDGDFELAGADPGAWFSHQHDSGFVPGDASLLALFDNSNLRYDADTSSHSRGQVWKLDEENMVARLVLNADLGAYSLALGSAQPLANGNYHFNLGWILGTTHSRSVEVDPRGRFVYEIEPATILYRSFRMNNLYGN